MTLSTSFQCCLAIAALQRAFPGHYLTALASPPAITYASPFQMMRLPPSALCQTLARLQGGAGNTESGSDNDSAFLPLTARTNDTVMNPPLTRPSVDLAPGGGGWGGRGG